MLIEKIEISQYELASEIGRIDINYGMRLRRDKMEEFLNEMENRDKESAKIYSKDFKSKAESWEVYNGSRQFDSPIKCIANILKKRLNLEIWQYFKVGRIIYNKETRSWFLYDIKIGDDKRLKEIAEVKFLKKLRSDYVKTEYDLFGEELLRSNGVDTHEKVVKKFYKEEFGL